MLDWLVKHGVVASLWLQLIQSIMEVQAEVVTNQGSVYEFVVASDLIALAKYEVAGKEGLQ